MTTTAEGPVPTDPAELEVLTSELHDLLHAQFDLVATHPIVVQKGPGTTGALLANVGDDLTVQAVGQLAVRVENHDLELSCVVHLSDLAGRVRRP